MRKGNCPAGKIRRASYTRHGYRRKDGTRVAATHVPSSCVPDTGAPGKTPAYKRVLPRPKPGMLRGWKGDASASSRHAAIRRAVASEGCPGVIRRLTLERNFTHRTSPHTAANAAKDARWLHKQGFCHLKTKNR